MKLKFVIIIAVTICFASCSFLGSKSTPSINLIPYASGGKYGYIDKEGKIIINPQFEAATVFMDGIALVLSSDNKYGYIGEDGKYIINPSYKKATTFCEGLACVVPENGKPQFIDEKGNVKFTVTTGEICGIFSEGFAAVKVGEKWGYLDKDGAVKINPQFDEAYPFSQGIAAVRNINQTSGEGLWGFINTKGEIVINYQFKFVGKFAEDMVVVSDGKKFGFIDKSGKYLINPQFDWAGEFKNGLAPIKQGTMYGYIDKEGKISINPQFNYASNFSDNGMACVGSTDGKFGYIDKEGKYIINPQFDRGNDFIGDISFVRSGDKFGIIDNKGKYLVNPQFEHINIKFNDYIFQTVKTDYFDVNGIVEKLTEGTNEKAFRNFTASTTISELKKSFPNIVISDYSWQAEVQESIVLNEHISIKDIRFNFSENPILEQKPVYRTVQKYDYWKGNYTAQEIDHYENIPNDNATLKSVFITVNLTDNKALQKSQQIFEAISEAIKTKASLTAANSKSFFENNHMEFTIGVADNTASYQAIFKKTVN